MFDFEKNTIENIQNDCVNKSTETIMKQWISENEDNGVLFNSIKVFYLMVQSKAQSNV